jgi:putative transposase
VPRIARLVVPGLPHHVVQRGVRSLDVFTADRDREMYLALMGEQCCRFGVQVLAWCLMTNHVHLVVIPAERRSLALAVGEAHRRFTRYRNFAERVRGYLFQGRFGSCVLDQSHLLAAARYVELNPVWAKLVGRAEAWPWSSARYHLRKVRRDPLVQDRTLLGLVNDVRGWRELLAEDDEELLKHLRQATRTGRPAGDGHFLAQVERLTGRELARRRPGPKPGWRRRRGSPEPVRRGR